MSGLADDQARELPRLISGLCPGKRITMINLRLMARQGKRGLRLMARQENLGIIVASTLGGRDFDPS